MYIIYIYKSEPLTLMFINIVDIRNNFSQLKMNDLFDKLSFAQK